MTRSGVPLRRVAGVVLEAIMFNAFSTTIGGAPAGTKTERRRPRSCGT